MKSDRVCWSTPERQEAIGIWSTFWRNTTSKAFNFCILALILFEL